MMLPSSIPLPMMNTANQRKVWRMVRLRAPKALSTPIIEVRSRMMMSNPLIMVTPATMSIRARMIHTLRSISPSHWKMFGFKSLMVALL